jgi:hypothetical protein
MKHKELIIRKFNELNNILSVQDSSISRLEHPDILKQQIERMRIKMNEIEVLLNNEDQQQFN